MVLTIVNRAGIGQGIDVDDFQEISMNINQDKIGKEFKVLIDRMESGTFIGRTEHDSPEVDNEVIIPAENAFLRIGDFTQIKITDATAFDLYGEPVTK